MIFDNDQRFVKPLQNRSPEVSHLFFEYLLEKILGDPTFSSSLNASPRSAINLMTKTKRCRSNF